MASAVTRPGVVELVGPAGAGKTTIRALLEAEGVRARGVWFLPPALLARSAVRVLPSCLQLWMGARAVLWEEAKHVVRMEGLYRLLDESRDADRRAWLLDEGPVFVFAWLRVVGREAGGPERFPGWWRAAVARWRRAVDLIVVLDAPNDVLVERIRTREKTHELKAAGDAETVRFLDRYRKAFADTIADLASGNGSGPEVRHIDTAATSPAVVAREVLAHLNGRFDAR